MMQQMSSMAMMSNRDDGQAEQDQNPQQQMMRQMQQQMMMGMGQMGAMQQMMMGGMQGSGCNAAMQGGTTSSSFSGDQRETERQMGRQAYANAMAALKRQDVPSDEEEGDVPPGPSASAHHPNYRPLDSQPLPGVTDQRYEGQIKLWFE